MLRSPKGPLSARTGAVYATVAVVLGLALLLVVSPNVDEQTMSPDSQAATGEVFDSAPTAATNSLNIQPRSATENTSTENSSALDAGSSASPSAARAEAEDVEVDRIPIPEQLISLFEPGSDSAEVHEQLEREPEEPIWATFNETEILGFLSRNPSLSEFEVLSLECRSRTCEVLMIGYGEMVDGRPYNTAVHTLFDEVLPSIGDEYWFDFTGANLVWDDLDSAAVGFQFILQRNELDDGSGVPVSEGGPDSGRTDSVSVLAPSESQSVNVNSIPIAEAFAGLFESNREWAEFHERLEREPDDLSWSTFMEAQLIEFFNGNPSFAELSPLMIECRTSSCEIQAVMYGGPGAWQLDMIAIGQQPWFEFENWQMAGGESPSPDAMTLIFRLDGEP